MDEDLESLTREQMMEEVRRLRAGIRQHRDASEHELCWHHPQLWALLPEKTEPRIAVPAWPQFMRGCIRYRQSLDQQAADAPRIDKEFSLKQSIGYVSLVVRDYDEAIGFYVGVLGFSLIEDTYIEKQDKRWVLVAPPGSTESCLLLARAADAEQSSRIGNQTGGRVFLFLHTDDFWRDYDSYRSKGVTFVREPKVESYGTVTVFKDLYGNFWDLLQLTSGR